MSKKVAATDQIVKLIVGAGNATPSPPVGPALGSKGVKAIDFCKEFNARTAHITPGIPMPARVTVRPDRSFTFELRTPMTSWLLLQASGGRLVKGKIKGAQKPGTEIVGTVSLKHIYEIAKIKQSEMRLSSLSLHALCNFRMLQPRATYLVSTSVTLTEAYAMPEVPGLLVQSVLQHPYLRPNLTFEAEANTITSLRSSDLDVWKIIGTQRTRMLFSPLMAGSRNYALAIFYWWAFAQFFVKRSRLEIEWTLSASKKNLVARNTSASKAAEHDFKWTEGLVGYV